MSTKEHKQEIEALLRAESHDPFRVLGAHRVTLDGSPAVVIRVLAPLAREAHVVVGEKAHPMDRQANGLFELAFRDHERLFDYKVRLRYEGGGREERHDAYAFAPQL